MSDLRAGEYFTIAARPRFRASQRRRIIESSKQGMMLAVGAALLDCLWLVPFHPDAAGLILGLNGIIAGVAAVGYVSIATFARYRAEVVVFAVLVAIDLATIALGLSRPRLAFVAAGYVLLLPTIVSLVIPWATRIHVTWLGLHALLVLGYALATPDAAVPAGAKDELSVLLIIAIAVSQTGHVVNLRARVQTFIQIERVRALNRQARRDHDRLDRLNAALERTASTDNLTGLGNRRALTAGLALIRARIDRQGERYGLLMLDLDRFKAINDELGHLGGDRILRAAADAVAGALRLGDTAFRWGGEEFVVLARLTEPPEALAPAERIRRAIEGLRIPDAANPPYDYLTMSIGVVSLGPAQLGADDDAWLAHADAAMYRAKANGRNRCELGSWPTDEVREGSAAEAG